MRAPWLVAAMISAPVQAGAASDMADCLHGRDPTDRVSACARVIAATSDRARLVRAHTARGNALCASAQHCSEAVDDFAAAARLEPGIAGYHDNLARSLRAAGRYDEALRESDRAIALIPRLGFVYYGRAKMLSATGRGVEALATIERAIALVPPDAGLWDYKGKLLGDLRRFPESHSTFERALQIQPGRPGVYLHRADVEVAEGRLAEAIADLERYPSDGIDGEQVHGKLDVLRALRGKEAAPGPVASNASDGGGVGREHAPVANAALDAPHSESHPEPAYRDPITSAPSPTCNVHSWTPLQRCIQEYHNENDPLPGGVPNPRRWWEEMAAQGRALAQQHPEITWDRSEWNDLASKAAQDVPGRKEKTPTEKVVDEPQQSDALPALSQATPPPGGEVDACNSARVLAIMTSGMDKFRSEVKELDAGAKPAAGGNPILHILEKWELSVRNIRQRSYDGANNIRYCAAEYHYNFELPAMIALVTMGVPSAKALCAAAVTYKIERTLDDPQNVYATHYCVK